MPTPSDYRYPFDSRYPFTGLLASAVPVTLTGVVDVQAQVRHGKTPSRFLTDLRGVTSVDANPRVRIADATGNAVLDMTAVNSVYAARSWGTGYKVHTWRTDTGVCQIVTVDPPTGGTFSGSIELDHRTVFQQPPCVTKVVANDTEITQRLELEGGYNCALSAETVETRPPDQPTTAVTVDMTAGNGLGRYPGCRDDLAIFTINGQGPDARGDFQLAGDDCYYATLPESNTIQLNSDCAPCWSCEEFKDLYEGLTRVRDAYRAQATPIEQIRRMHEAVVGRYNTAVTCRNNHDLRITPIKIAQQIASVSFRYRNTTGECQHNVVLSIFYTGSSGTEYQYPRSGLVTYADGRTPEVILPHGLTMDFGIEWGTIPPGQTARYRYTILLQGGTERTVNASVKSNGTVLAGPVTASLSTA